MRFVGTRRKVMAVAALGACLLMRHPSAALGEEVEPAALKALVKLMTAQRKDVETLKAKVAALEAAAAKQAKELQRRHSQIDEMHKIIQNQTASIGRERVKAERAAREKLTIEKDYNRSVKQCAELAKKLLTVERELAHQNAIVDRLDLRPLGPGALPERKAAAPAPVTETKDAPITPPVFARVLAVDAMSGLVMLSIGSKDGVAEGQVFVIHSEGEATTQATVEKVFPDMCSARAARVPAGPGGRGKAAKISVNDAAFGVPAQPAPKR